MSKTFHYDDTLGFVRRTLRYGNAPTIIESTKREARKKMTNKEWMSALHTEQFFDKMMWLIKDYGMRFNNTRLAVIIWLDEPHESEEEDETDI